MAQFASSDEVFLYWRDKFGTDGDGDVDAIALFSYAIVEQERVSWSEHLKIHSGSAPSATETADWFRAKPPSYFDEKEKQAAPWFMGFARAALAAEIERANQRAVERVVGNLRRFWPGFFAGIAAGIAGNFLFLVLLFLFLVIARVNFSVVELAKQVLGP